MRVIHVWHAATDSAYPEQPLKRRVLVLAVDSLLQHSCPGQRSLLPGLGGTAETLQG